VRGQLYLSSAKGFFIFALLLMLFSQVALSVASWPAIKGQLVPELDQKALTVAKSVSLKIGRAMDYGIPLEGLTGVDDFFGEILSQTEGLSYLALTRLDGTVLVSRGIDANRLQTPVRALFPGIRAKAGIPLTLAVPSAGGNPEAKQYRNTAYLVFQNDEIEAAMVHVGFDPGYAERKIGDLRYDVVIVLFASLLIGFEILLAALTRNFIGPLRALAEWVERMARGDFRSPAPAVPSLAKGLHARLSALAGEVRQTLKGGLGQMSPVDEGSGVHAGSMMKDVIMIRILTFLFMFASMLSRPFLPVYLKGFADDGLGLSAELVASLPITIYLGVMALSMPYVGRWSDTHGRQAGFMAGAVLMALGLCGTALSESFWLLVLSRAVEGVGYASLFMSCQGFVVDNTSAENRSRGVATFVSAIMVSEVSAPAVGGVLADSLGFRGVFIVAAVLALIAVPVAYRILGNGAAPVAPTIRKGEGISALLRNGRFVTIAFLAAIPAKLLHSGFLIFLTPVILSKFGSSPSEIGRFAIVYGVVALLAMPVFSNLADRYRCHAAFVITGGVIAGAGMLPILLAPQPAMVLLGILALGAGQAMSISPQLTLITRALETGSSSTAGAGSALGIFRLIERVGGALGPILAGLLALKLGPVTAMAVLGVIMLVSILSCSAVLVLQARGKEVPHAA
jgi:MFS family permease